MSAATVVFSAIYILLLHLLPHGSVAIAVSILVAATPLETTASFAACCTPGRCRYVSYASYASPVISSFHSFITSYHKDETFSSFFTTAEDGYSEENTATYKRDQNAAKQNVRGNHTTFNRRSK